MLKLIHGTERHLNWVRGPVCPDREEWTPKHRLLLAPAVLPLTAFIAAWDQGQEGSCTGHGNGRLAAHRYHIMTGQSLMPSRQWLYWKERKLEGTTKTDSGAIVGDGIKVLETLGVPPETLWPYTKKLTTTPSKASNVAALLNRNWVGQTIPASVDAIKQAIGAGNPCSGGFDVYSSFESQAVADSGVMPVPSRRESLLGGHCVVWDGYDDNFSALGHTGFLYCANSWGTTWGRNGWFMMPYDNIKYCSDFHILLPKAA